MTARAGPGRWGSSLPDGGNCRTKARGPRQERAWERSHGACPGGAQDAVLPCLVRGLPTQARWPSGLSGAGGGGWGTASYRWGQHQQVNVHFTLRSLESPVSMFLA